MRLRGPFVTIGALGLALLAVGLVAVWTSIGRAEAIRKTMPGTTMKINSVVTFASSPSDAMPALTAGQALRQSEEHLGAHVTAIRPGLTAKLGLFTCWSGQPTALGAASSSSITAWPTSN